MKTPKTLIAFATVNSLKVAKINFRHAGHGTKQVGYSLINTSIWAKEGLYSGAEMVEIEPVSYSNGDRWIIRQRGRADRRLSEYAKTIKQAIAWIDLEALSGDPVKIANNSLCSFSTTQPFIN